ncbi:O-succinylhomoserine sulfhydrylase [Streptomyces sp. P17]|uniref:O-succinylhomoserine sulfhydrylase n=1 Tax=Streptomyces sp. P17 TaxID=3074716 RepID=UPI0028F45524|nr:O-succinylhomoserine sulfhydrylase [Streptomyces sp. P17]MDT9698131.1 O-succinylhomoserine sulfhydrylase [Streptomyces sp. P17]
MSTSAVPDAPRSPATLAVRTGQYQDLSDLHSEGLALTASYLFADAEDAAEKFAGRRPGNVYVRFGNPTTAAFEERLAAMEQAESAVAVASGMAAFSALALALLKAGDHVVLADGMFGTTPRFFQTYMAKFGVTSTVVGVRDTAAWARAVRDDTVMFIVETPTNPVMEVADLRALGALATANGVLLVVDNTLCTPVFQNPLSLGADLVVHSTAKYIDGQGRCGGGILAGRNALTEQIRDVLRTAGPSPSPFNSWVFLKSLETLGARMREHARGGQAVAEWLQEHPAVHEVHYTGLRTHPQWELANAQQSGHGGLVSFTVRGGRAAAWSVLDGLRLISNTTNIGDTKSMVTHPASTTHGRLSDADRSRAGVVEGMLRVSVGLEDPADVIADLRQALDRAQEQGLTRDADPGTAGNPVRTVRRPAEQEAVA